MRKKRPKRAARVIATTRDLVAVAADGRRRRAPRSRGGKAASRFGYLQIHQIRKTFAPSSILMKRAHSNGSIICFLGWESSLVTNTRATALVVHRLSSESPRSRFTLQPYIRTLFQTLIFVPDRICSSEFRPSPQDRPKWSSTYER